jgi:hypothetical protein
MRRATITGGTARRRTRVKEAHSDCLTRGAACAVEAAMRKVVLLLLFAPLAQAAPATGLLRGQVVAAGGTRLAGVTVVVEGGETARSSRSGPDGTFVIDELLPGSYRIDASAEGYAPGTAAATIEAGQAVSVSISLGAGPTARESVRHTSGGLLAGMPLWSRTAPALLRLSLALRARAGAHPLFAPAHGRPEWQLDGFDFTHPITGGPVVAVGLGSLVSPGTKEVGPGAWGTGPLASLVTQSGYNRYDFGATTVARPPGQGAVEAEAVGAILKDRLWFAVSGQAEERRGAATSGRGLSKLTFQAAPRHRMTLLTALGGGQPGSSRAHFNGLRWEAVASDAVIVSLHASAMEDRGGATLPASAMATGQGRLEWFLNTRELGEHAISLSASASRVTVAEAAGARWHLDLEDRWQPTRHLTVGAASGLTVARPTDGSRLVGPSGRLSLVWDATHDGRTAVRIRGSTAAVPGLDAIACLECASLTRVDEIALGAEREMGKMGTAGGVEVLGRRALVDGQPEREALVALHLRHHRQGYKLSALYQGRVLPSPSSELLALASLGLTRWLSAGALVIRAPRATWLPLFEEPAGPLVPALGGNAWLLGLQLRAEVGELVGIPAALWVDALNLTGDRGTLATAGLTPVRAPPFQVRVGLRIEY